MTKLERAAVGAALILLVILAASMSGSVAPIANGGLPETTQATSAGSRVVREGLLGPVQTLNPLFARTHAELDIDALLFRGLTRLGSGARVVPDLAESWTISPDGKTYTFRLRPDAVWHDGARVTADDVVFTVLTLQHPAYTGPLAGTWRGVTAEKLDAFRVRFRLATPSAHFLSATTQAILPAHLLVGTPVAHLAASSFASQPIGNGPFRLVSLDTSGARLERVVTTNDGAAPSGSLPPLPFDPSTWRPAGDSVPGVDAFVFTFYSSTAEIVAAFRAGELDAAGGLDATQARSLASASGVRILRYPRTVLTSVVLNLRFGRSLFQTSHERRALLLAIDRDALVREVLGGMGARADSLLPPTSWAFDASAAGRVPYDRATAAKELKAAGWKRIGSAWDRPGANGAVSFELVTLDEATNPTDYAVAQRVAADWRAIGLRVTVTALPAAKLASERLVPGKYDAAIVDLNLGLDPDVYPLLASGQAVNGGSNISGYQSASLDPLLQAARQYASDATRLKRMSALQAGLAREIPILPLFFSDYAYVLRDTVTGPRPRAIASASDRFWDVLTWRTAEQPGP